MTFPITFGKYQLLERINVGGMAEVFKAKAFGVEGFERILAIKRILPNMADDDEFISMFVDEARLAVQLSHSNIVQVFELGKFENQYYIAMEYVSGKDLRQILDRCRKTKVLLPLSAVAYIVGNICEGLEYAHRKVDATGRHLKLIHRDVSPQNILVSYEGTVKITDFGIAKAESRASKTQAGVLKGKFAYMSPEQVRGLEVDHRSDIFAVGILLYEMLTGKRLFVGDSDFATLELVRQAKVDSPREHNADIPEELEKICLKALAREAQDRYGWAAEMAADLQHFLATFTPPFTPKDLVGWMANEYGEDLAKERQRMEEIGRMPPPSEEAREAARSIPPARPATDWTGDFRGEKTMVFESGFGSFVPAPVSRKDKNEESQTRQIAVPPKPPPVVTPAPKREISVGNKTAAPAPVLLVPQRSYTPWVLALIALIVIGAVGSYFWERRFRAHGTLIVTSTPSTNLEIFMDGDAIGNATPLIQADVSLGEHTLLLRAPGYSDKAYRFEMAAGAPAQIRVTLDRLKSLERNHGASVEIISDPPGASVRIGGLPQGVTPVTLVDQDDTRPLVVEVVKPGYESQVITLALDANGPKQSQVVRLVAVGAKTPAPGPTPTAAPETPAAPSVTPSVPVETTPATPKRPPRPRPVPEKKTKSSDNGCTITTDSKLSVMVSGYADCKVKVGKVLMGVAPFLKHDSPTGSCQVTVECPNGKRFETTRTLVSGGEEKIIVKGEELN